MPAPPQNLDDVALADWLDQCCSSRHTVGYLHAQYVCKVFDLTDRTGTLHPADPDKRSKTALRKLARLGLLRHLELPVATLNAARAVDPAWDLAPATQDQITALVGARLLTLGRAGRGAAISQKTAWRVWTDAGGRCMFAGCGMDLTGIPLYNEPARVGYLAHIVASDPNGPRGNQADSHLLSDKPDNIMLMCDAHHRLIDCFAPAEHPADILFAMRQSHRDLVCSYLDSLAFPRAKAVTLHANLAHIPTYFHDSELIDAILATGRAMLPGVVHYVRRNQRDDRRTPEVWVQYLHEHYLQIQQLVNSFNDPGAADVDELAVFPLHHIATMVLAGRIIGEARSVQVFQYHRHRRTWRWDPDARPQPAGTFNLSGLTPDRADEVLITIELTANLDEEAIPENLMEAIAAGRMPRVRITTPNPDGACIRHPDDLDQFMNVARRAINHVQDVMRARSVHLIAISPASTVFCFGQMLQAGHHPTYTVYDRAGRDTPFGEAFSISGHEVTARAGSQTTIIPIR
jgi:hypothetical protein